MAKSDQYRVRFGAVGDLPQGTPLTQADAEARGWDWPRLVDLGAVSPETEAERANVGAQKQADLTTDLGSVDTAARQPALTTGSDGGAPLAETPPAVLADAPPEAGGPVDAPADSGKGSKK